MRDRTALTRNLLLLVLAIQVCTQTSFAQTNKPSVWTVRPAYETAAIPTAFTIQDPEGVTHTLYEESNAVLIFEGNYNDQKWDRVAGPVKLISELLTYNLERRGFHVLMWKDLTGTQLHAVLSELYVNVGSAYNSRLFFYFYGHGHTLPLPNDLRNESKTFLVPVDAPHPTKQVKDFLRLAVPIEEISALSNKIFAKHTFFALEACDAGAIMNQRVLGETNLYPKRLGYVLSQSTLAPDHVILTAGSADENIPATGLFASLLAAALEQSSVDPYVTGADVTRYVQQKIAQTGASPILPTPRVVEFPADHGDFIFGLAKPEDIGPLSELAKSLINGYTVHKLVEDVFTCERFYNDLNRKLETDPAYRDVWTKEDLSDFSWKNELLIYKEFPSESAKAHCARALMDHKAPEFALICSSEYWAITASPTRFTLLFPRQEPNTSDEAACRLLYRLALPDEK